MTPRLVTTEHGQYEPAPYSGSNTSGIEPIGDRLVVLPDEAASTVGKLGLIMTTKSQQETSSLGAVTGTIYAVGEDAWRWNSTQTQPFAGRRPQPGDRVIFNRYSGQVVKGLDGKDYRVMSESTVGGLLLSTQEGANG